MFAGCAASWLAAEVCEMGRSVADLIDNKVLGQRNFFQVVLGNELSRFVPFQRAVFGDKVVNRGKFFNVGLSKLLGGFVPLHWSPIVGEGHFLDGVVPFH